MRYLALCLALAACGGTTPSPAPADAPADTPVVDVAPEAAVPCGGLCGAGTVCQEGRCVMQGGDAAVDSPTAMEAAIPDVVEEATVDADTRCTAPTSFCDNPTGCYDLSTNNMHCGRCDVACGAGSRCEAGVCASFDAGTDAPTCPSGFGDCDGDPRNGCEVNLANGRREDSVGLQRENCGMCRRNCAAPNACCAGMCLLPDASVSGLTCSRLP